ncbi:hypothetical protein [Nostoc sp. FACHB-190]|uniref:hypothetical protein n=1 Tax=Nostoc sp. FACHB-190 TaxID=2692838 RepID=UPI0016839FEF|nr:hypothetical protein [Nostoc sp. FACHB-190]MBD2302834.1 hypothetical protein [Nostoc sp. FACHB-190]
MSQIEVAQIIEQIKQEITVDASGKAKASIRATARLAGVSATAILKTFESVNQEPSKLAQMLLESWFEAVNLQEWRTDGIPDKAIAIILEYYAHEAGRYCTKQARLVCRSFNTIGIRAWIQEKLGWTKPTTANETALTQIQLLAAIAQQMAEQEQRLLQQQQQQAEILHRLKDVEIEQDRFNTPSGHKYSIVGFANLQGLEISAKEASAKGKKASALCRKQNIEIERIHDPRFGRVGLYPESVLIEVFCANQN